MKENFYILVLLAMLGTALLVVLFIGLQIRSQNKVLHQKRRLQEAELLHQKALLEAVITSQETERKRIGMDLHDEVGAVLAALRMNMEKQAAELQDGAAVLLQFKPGIDRVVDSVRNIAHSLSPRITGSFGFIDAVHELADAVNRAGGPVMIVRFDERQQVMFSDERTAMALYRVLAELVSNTLKHAAAQQINLAISLSDDRLGILYKDDGTGMPASGVPATGIGLRNIESRLGMIGALWQQTSNPATGYGMSITVSIK